MAGAGAGLLPHPELQIRGQQLEEGACSTSVPDHHLTERLYWHRWVLEGFTSRYPGA